MENWIKINDEVFYIKDISMQLSFGSHATVELFLDTLKYPEYTDVFFKRYENKEKFNIIAKNFECRGTLIKAIDMGKSSLNVSLRCDYTNQTPIEERREILIDDILNIQDKKDIN